MTFEVELVGGSGLQITSAFLSCPYCESDRVMLTVWLNSVESSVDCLACDASASPVNGGASA